VLDISYLEDDERKNEDLRANPLQGGLMRSTPQAWMYFHK